MVNREIVLDFKQLTEMLDFSSMIEDDNHELLY